MFSSSGEGRASETTVWRKSGRLPGSDARKLVGIAHTSHTTLSEASWPTLVFEKNDKAREGQNCWGMIEAQTQTSRKVRIEAEKDTDPAHLTPTTTGTAEGGSAHRPTCPAQTLGVLCEPPCAKPAPLFRVPGQNTSLVSAGRDSL